VGEVRDAQSVPAVRVALLKLFDGFTLHSFAEPANAEAPLPEGWVRSRDYTDLDLLVAGDGGWYVEPHPKAHLVLDKDTRHAFPVLARTPITPAETNSVSAP